jgi:DNA-binding MarR family transcriptional regulator
VSVGGEREPGHLLFEFVRHWSRRWTGAGERGTAEQGRLVLVTEAVHSLGHRGEVTINTVAEEIGIDQSGASRLVSSAVVAGYLEMRASRADRRRREVSITPAGIGMLDDAHQWQERVFALLTADWTNQQRNDFQRAMVSMLERSHALAPRQSGLSRPRGKLSHN